MSSINGALVSSRDVYQRQELPTVKLHGKAILWDHFISVFSRESKRTLPVTKINTDAIYLNNFSKMMVNWAVNMLSTAVEVEMEENENDVTKSNLRDRKCLQMNVLTLLKIHEKNDVN